MIEEFQGELSRQIMIVRSAAFVPVEGISWEVAE